MEYENSGSLVCGSSANFTPVAHGVYCVIFIQAGIKEETIDIPHSLHVSLLAAKGQFIRAISDECGGILIRFPSPTSKSDKVLLRGSAEEIEKAKGMLTELAHEKVSDWSLHWSLLSFLLKLRLILSDIQRLVSVYTVLHSSLSNCSA